jgi:flagellar FliJ protein
MPKFNFRLATFLKLREAFRDERQAELAEVYRADEILVERDGEVRREMAAQQQSARQGVAPGPVNVDRLIGVQRYDLELRGRLALLAHQRQLLSGEIQRRRQALVEANREVRVLEKLRDKQAEKFRAAENYRETKQLDEIAQQRAVHEEAEA